MAGVLLIRPMPQWHGGMGLKQQHDPGRGRGTASRSGSCASDSGVHRQQGFEGVFGTAPQIGCPAPLTGRPGCGGNDPGDASHRRLQQGLHRRIPQAVDGRLRPRLPHGAPGFSV